MTDYERKEGLLDDYGLNGMMLTRMTQSHSRKLVRARSGEMH